ncbi:MAG TPA: hemerythrin domain-containing protein [Solirubrobacteraceae bacterium]|nr:hemerythrin domain-containing protein [Solirubrobacteraceae bacterium]
MTAPETGAGAASVADTLAAALEREHHVIDEGIEEFLAAERHDSARIEPLRRAIAALRRHIFLEEEFLFGPLRDAGLVAPIFVMLREHGEIWDTLDAIEARLRPDLDEDAIDELCRQLLGALARHNAKEEAIVYPQANTVLDAAADAGLRAFLTAGRMPDGWTCAQAGG